MEQWLHSVHGGMTLSLIQSWPEVFFPKIPWEGGVFSLHYFSHQLSLEQSPLVMVRILYWRQRPLSLLSKLISFLLLPLCNLSRSSLAPKPLHVLFPMLYSFTDQLNFGKKQRQSHCAASEQGVQWGMGNAGPVGSSPTQITPIFTALLFCHLISDAVDQSQDVMPVKHELYTQATLNHSPPAEFKKSSL